MHGYYKTAVDATSERDLLQRILSDSVADDYMPWSGPGLDVEGPNGWVWLKVKKLQRTVVVSGLHGEHIFALAGFTNGG